jgi:hypothetical protein
MAEYQINRNSISISKQFSHSTVKAGEKGMIPERLQAECGRRHE